VSTVDERGALNRGMSLFEHATRLHERNPDAPLRCGGRPYPDHAAQPGQVGDRLPISERRAALRSILEMYFSDPSAPVQVLHEDLSRLDVSGRIIESAVAERPPVDAERSRETGVWLLRNATARRPALVGLALLAGAGRPDDVPLIRTIGLLDALGPAAAKALTAMPGTTADLIWLAERSTTRARTGTIEALSRRGDPEANAWLLRHAVGSDELSASLARQIAEATSLADALETGDIDDEIWDQGGQLLLAMITPNDYRVQLADYRDARRVHQALARHVNSVRPSMERYALMVSLLEDLRTGYAACLDWDPGERHDVLDRLRATLRRDGWAAPLAEAGKSPDPLVRRRAEWARTAVRSSGPDEDRGGPRRLDVDIAVLDPCRRGDAQTRVLIDGRPVIAASFDKGAAHAPETLLTSGRLRASVQPHEVQLAEAYCTEGCCGALYVTVARQGDTVVWSDWRGYTSPEPPPQLRFAAADYDAEIARAENDHTWEWRARTVARLLRAHLAARPDLLTRWQCQPCWVAARAHEPSQLRFTFYYPERPTFPEPNPWLQFELVIPIDATPADELAAGIVRQLETLDPKTAAAVVGGHRDHAEQLGYHWPESTR
jgi:hypothetical protein